MFNGSDQLFKKLQ